VTHGERTPWASRILARMLDHRKRLDYLWLAAFAASPIALAWWINAFETNDGFLGYGERPNWTLLVIVLPLAAYTLRWIARHIGPVSSPEMPPTPPPVIGLIKTDDGRALAYATFRGMLLAPRNLFAALLVTLLIQMADMAQLGGFYLSGASQICASTAAPVATDQVPGICAQELPPQGALQWLQISFLGNDCKVEKDWSVAYLSSAPTAPGKWTNAVLNVSAYSVQFAVIFIAMLLIIVILRHNLFFLSRVYQRRRVKPGEEASYVHIDLDDKEKCFGFRAANKAFNVQVLALAFAGVFILTTRFANIGLDGDGVVARLFPDFGQYIALITWLVALAIISLPILVKLLPRITAQGAENEPTSLVGYLREFLSDDAWAFNKDTPPEEIDAVAGQFARNAFWPTGNNRAWQLYFVAFWVFFIALVPDPRAIAPDLLPQWSMAVGWVVEGAFAWLATWVLFRFLRAMLTYIDNRLVELPAQLTSEGAAQRRRKIPIGVFISYRRDETAAYTGRLYDNLCMQLDKDKVFMDLDKIPGGVDFTEVLTKAIDSAAVMIVVIGPSWLTISHSNGTARIQDPSDFVHQEIAHGLRRNIRLFPVLVGGAMMPSEADLPESLKKLAARNALEISDSRWDHDVGRLIGELGAVPQ